jgi:hypothetical protein
MRLDDATRRHILKIIDRALRDDDELVSRALAAHLAHPHLLSRRHDSDKAGPPWTKYLMIANMIAAILFSMIVISCLYVLYVRFIIRKRSFKEHFATWQNTQFEHKPQRHEMFYQAVLAQHLASRRIEQQQHEEGTHDSDDQSDERRKRE